MNNGVYNTIMINKHRHFLITATRKEVGADIWSMTKQMPAFIIDTEIQGIASMKSLDFTVMEIIGAGGQYVAEPLDIHA